MAKNTWISFTQATTGNLFVIDLDKIVLWQPLSIDFEERNARFMLELVNGRKIEIVEEMTEADKSFHDVIVRFWHQRLK